MSFIQSTIQCLKCGFEMNVSTGTFGGGIPAKCPECEYQPTGNFYKFISDGWNAKDRDVPVKIKFKPNKGHIYKHEDAACEKCGTPWADTKTLCPK